MDSLKLSKNGVIKRTAGCSGSKEIWERVKQYFFTTLFKRSKRTSVESLTKCGSQSPSSIKPSFNVEASRGVTSCEGCAAYR